MSSLAFVVAGIWIHVRAQRHIVDIDAIAVGLGSLSVSAALRFMHSPMRRPGDRARIVRDIVGRSDVPVLLTPVNR